MALHQWKASKSEENQTAIHELDQNENEAMVGEWVRPVRLSEFWWGWSTGHSRQKRGHVLGCHVGESSLQALLPEVPKNDAVNAASCWRGVHSVSYLPVHVVRYILPALTPLCFCSVLTFSLKSGPSEKARVFQCPARCRKCFYRKPPKQRSVP